MTSRPKAVISGVEARKSSLNGFGWVETVGLVETEEKLLAHPSP
jgi:hypothetical protein